MANGEFCTALIDNFEAFTLRRQRAPRLWRAAWTSTKDPIEAVFAHKGFDTWFIFHLARSASRGRPFKGKKRVERIVVKIEGQSEHDLKDLASQLTTAITTTHSRLISTFTQRKREVSPPSQDLSPPCTTYDMAALSKMSEIFAQPFLGWIATNTFEQADICMNFPPPSYSCPALECQITLQIIDEQIPQLAQDLCGVCVETKTGLRSIRSANGSCVVPTPQVMLEGFSDPQIIRRILGKEVEAGITNSPRYQADIAALRRTTVCIYLVISNTPIGGQVVLTPSLKYATQWRNTLFHSHHPG